MPNSDPASLKATLALSGLSVDEALTVVASIPAGADFNASTIKPAIGGKRYTITAEGLSIQGAKDVATALFLHVDRVANGVVKHLVRYGEPRPVCCGRSITELPGVHEITVTATEVTCPGRRNPHCSNCGDTRGGPVGHEIGECTYQSASTTRPQSSAVDRD